MLVFVNLIIFYRLKKKTIMNNKGKNCKAVYFLIDERSFIIFEPQLREELQQKIKLYGKFTICYKKHELDLE